MYRRNRIAHCDPADAPRPRVGFTLIELLVVIAIIGILAGLLLPVLVSAKLKTQGIQCINNHRSLMLAWHMYNDDNGEHLLSSSPDVCTSPLCLPYFCVLAWLHVNPCN